MSSGNNALSGMVQNFYTFFLQCRPSDPIQFAALYFEDESKIDSDVRHAMRSLKYITDQRDLFGEAACTIFTNMLSRKKIGLGLMQYSVAQEVVAILFEESYLPYVPADIRRLIETSVPTDCSMSLIEFTAFMNFTVSVALLYENMKCVVLESLILLGKVTHSSSLQCAPESLVISSRDLLSCITTSARIKAFITTKFQRFELPESDPRFHQGFNKVHDLFLLVIKGHMQNNHDRISIGDIISGLLNFSGSP